MARIAIVSAFGRANCLAKACVSLGLDVSLIDLSLQFSWPKHYWIGPAPIQISDYFLNNENLKPKFKVPLREVAQGLSFLTQKGSFEFRGSLIRHRLQAESLNLQTLEPLQFQIKDFQADFLAALFTKALSPLEIEPSRALPKAQNIQMTKEIYLGFREMDLGQSANLQVYDRAKIEDVAFGTNSKISGLLMQTGRSQMLEVDQLVWALSSQETQFLSSRLSEKIFAGQVRESTMSWICFEIETLNLETLPDYLIWCEDPEMPWSDEHLLIFQRQEKSSRFLVWMKVLSEHRFQSSLLEDRKQALKKNIESRWPKSQVLEIQEPLEKTATSKTLGPALFASYREGLWSKVIEPKLKNLFFLNPETLNHFGFQCEFEKEVQIFEQIQSWWKNELELKAKNELKEKKL